jgi:hypothetical protein
MKVRNFYFLSILLLSAAMTSCSSSDVEEGTAAENTQKAVFKAAMPDDGTRVTLTDPTKSGLTTNWTAGDKVLAVDITKGNVSGTFALTSGVGTASGTFAGTVTGGLSDQDKVCAYYPSTLTLTGNSVAADYSTQKGDLSGVQDQTVLYTEPTTYTSDGNSTLYFKHAASYLRININVGKQATIKTVTLLGNALTANDMVSSGSFSGSSWTSTKAKQIVATLNNGSGTATDGNGKLTVYMAVLPQALANGFTLVAKDADGYAYKYTRNASTTFAQGKIHTINSSSNAWTNTSKGIFDGKHYEWDAKAAYPTDGTTPDAGTDSYYNTTTFTVSNPPTAEEGASKTYPTQNAEFKNCPTYNEITWYLAGGIYYDANQRWGAGENEKGGLWLKKKTKIIADDTKGAGSTAVTAETFTSSQSGITIVNSTTNPTLILTIAPDDLYTNWFFLPATGYYYNGTLYNAGTVGYYWSSTPSTPSTPDGAWNLIFFDGNASVACNYRSNGFCLWAAQ